jgi:hypothetical protein
MNRKLPQAMEAEFGAEGLESILWRAEKLAKVVETMQDGPRKLRLRAALAAMEAIGGQVRSGTRNTERPGGRRPR